MDYGTIQRARELGAGAAAIRWAALTVVLSAVAWASPTAWPSSDRHTYERLSARPVDPDCADVHCFRPLVPWILGRVPGQSIVVWRGYAVAVNAMAAVALAQLCLTLGLSRRAADLSMVMAAVGFGSMYTIYDCYTSDPLMFFVGPYVTRQVALGRRGRGVVASAIGVLAKEFAAAPLWIAALWAALERRHDAARRAIVDAVAVTLWWASIHTTLMALYNYSYLGSTAADVFGGGYLATWLGNFNSPVAAIVAMIAEFGAIWLLMPAWWRRAGAPLRSLAIASVPPALALAYVQQPDRALWNFHFVAIPLAVVVLEAAPAWLAWLFVALFALTNLRVGAQLAWAPPARIPLALSLAVAVGILVLAARRRASGVASEIAGGPPAPMRRAPLRVAVVLECVWAAALLVSQIDMKVRSRLEATTGINAFGYRGRATLQAGPDPRIALVGGSAAYGVGLKPDVALGAWLQDAVNGLLNKAGDPREVSVANLAELGAGAASYRSTLADYRFLHPRIVCVYDGYAAVDAQPRHARRDSVVFRLVKYLPALADSNETRNTAEDGRALVDPALVDDAAQHDSCDGPSAAYCRAMVDTVRFALDERTRVVVVTPPYLSRRHEMRQRALAVVLAQRFGDDRRFAYVDAGAAVDLQDRRQTIDGVHLTVESTSEVARVVAPALAAAVRAEDEPAAR